MEGEAHLDSQLVDYNSYYMPHSLAVSCGVLPCLVVWCSVLQCLGQVCDIYMYMYIYIRMHI